MQRYFLEVTYERAGKAGGVIIATRAVDEDEALRAAHTVADMAEWLDAENIRVAVTASDGRDVGMVYDDDLASVERPERKAATYEPPGGPA